MPGSSYNERGMKFDVGQVSSVALWVVAGKHMGIDARFTEGKR